MTDLDTMQAMAAAIQTALRREQSCADRPDGKFLDHDAAFHRSQAEGHLQDLAAEMGYDIMKVAK